MKKVCLITPAHISSNPRLVKEARTLAANAYAVHLIFTQNLAYLSACDAEILHENPAWTYSIKPQPQSVFLRKIAALGQRVRTVFTPDFSVRTARMLNRFFDWQLKMAIAVKADLYIAHNPGALPVAVLAARTNRAKCGFDAEDFHRNELSDDPQHPDVRKKTQLEDLFLPQLDYLTASSPMIAGAYEELTGRDIPVLLNVFEKTNRKTVTEPDPAELKIAWFSQTIGPNRGLETAIQAITAVTDTPVSLHLLGQADPVYRKSLEDMAAGFAGKGHRLVFHEPVSPGKIVQKLAGFDIGLASEPGFSANNSMALSNKLFTYLQCGMAVLLSDTAAQADFFFENPGIGKIYKKNDHLSLSAAISHFANDRAGLSAVKTANHARALDRFNWENESQKFTALINRLWI